jgi:hypothetical protein
MPAQTWSELGEAEQKRITEAKFEELDAHEQGLRLRECVRVARDALTTAQANADWAEVGKQAKRIAELEEKLGTKAEGIKPDPVAEMKTDEALAEAYAKLGSARRAELMKEDPDKWKQMLDAHRRQGLRKLEIDI